MKTTLTIGALLCGLSALQTDPAFARYCLGNADCADYCTDECEYGYCSQPLNPLDWHCACAPRGDFTPCASDGNPCSRDHCEGGNCTHDDVNSDNPDIVCRPAADECDVPEYCNALYTTCPADSKQPNYSVICRPAFFACDVSEYCFDGVCPPNSYRPAGSTCRSSSDGCDLAEACDGTSRYCPADEVKAAGIECRAASGSCDVAEACDGASTACPSDQVRAAGVICLPSSGAACDLDDYCTGTGKSCPTRIRPSGQVCRAATDACDVAETCDGFTSACPSDGFRPQTFTCRAAVDACDRAESCTGTGAACPVDLKQQDGTPCPDGAYCDGVEACQAGVCTASAEGPCGLAPCEETSDLCLTDQCPTQPQACQTAGKGVLVVKNNTDDAKDKLIWKFVNGTAATTRDDFADPTDSAPYVLCLYSDAASANPEAVAIPIPPDASRWQPLGDKGYKYFDEGGTQGGAQKVIVKSGDVGKTKALVKAAGVELPAILDSGALPLPVEVQLFNYAANKCWDTTFTAPDDNSDLRFKAKNF